MATLDNIRRDLNKDELDYAALAQTYGVDIRYRS